MKKLFPILIRLLVSLFFTAVPTAAGAAQEIADVPPNHWAYQAVKQLVSQGYLGLYPDQTFRGDQPVDRYTMAVLVARLLSEAVAGKTVLGREEADLLRRLTAEFRQELVAVSMRTKTLEEAVARYENERKALGADLAATRDELAGTRGEVAALQDELAGTQGEVTELQGGLAGTRDEVAALQGELTGTQGEVTELQGGLAGTRDEVAGLREELARSAREIVAIKERIMNLESSCGAVAQDVGRLEGSLDNLSREVGELEGRLHDLAAETKARDEANAAAIAEAGRFSDVGRKDLAELSQRINLLQDELRAWKYIAAGLAVLAGLLL